MISVHVKDCNMHKHYIKNEELYLHEMNSTCLASLRDLHFGTVTILGTEPNRAEPSRLLILLFFKNSV